MSTFSQSRSTLTKTNRISTKRTLKIVIGVIAVLVGMGFVMPALAQWRHEGVMTGSSVALCLLGAVLTLAGGDATIHGVTKRGA
jgi:hypothetical protein